MAQLQKGTTYTTGSSVTASNLNAHVDSAVLLNGAIADQTALGAATASDDKILISDTTATALKSATPENILATEVTNWVGKGASGGTAALQINGTDKLSVDSSGNTTVAGDLSVTGDIAVTGGGLMPSGSVTQFAGSSAPTGWLMCDGTAVPRTTYASLFTAISTTYGTGDGSTTFNLPDLRGRVAIGAGQGRDNSGSGTITSRTIGTYEGEEDHVLTEAELASHTHDVGPIYKTGNESTYTAWMSGQATGSATVTSDSAGSGTAHNTMQPYLVLGGYIIKT